MAARKCTVPGCEGKHEARGLCKKHWHRLRRTGSLEVETKTLEERFHEKYIICPMSGCWLWTASTFPAGYGKLNVGGKIVYAHRLSWELHNGPIPEHDSHHGMCVLHKCDTPPCVRPDHLFLGTNQDNIADMMQKGRRTWLKGSASGMSKLTEEQALGIFHAQGAHREIAARYGVAHSQVSSIKRKKKWKHIHD